MNKFIICSQPRTGSHAVLNAIRASGMNPCPSEPFWIETRIETDVSYYDHVAYSSAVLNKYDGFKIILGHTQQLQDICSANNAALIALRRVDLYAHLASYIIFLLTSPGVSTESFNDWTSGGRNLRWDKDLIKNIPFFNHHIDKIIYNNWLIDNVLPTYRNYAFTIEYENMSKSNALLSVYLGKKIELVDPPVVGLDHYFTNPEDFISYINQRLEQLHAQK